jgi:RNA polymerase sigma-70 factor (sigma-E family)
MEWIHTARPPANHAGEAAALAATPEQDGRAAVTALYRDHALGLIRLAHVMLGDKAAAEDVVQEAFCGLYRRWLHLADPGKALPYLRASVLNGCRSLQRRTIREAQAPVWSSRESADPTLTSDERRMLIDAMRQLPDRQREALVFRFYLDMSDEQIASEMGISQGTVRSTTHRGLAALGIALKESS